MFNLGGRITQLNQELRELKSGSNGASSGKGAKSSSHACASADEIMQQHPDFISMTKDLKEKIQEMTYMKKTIRAADDECEDYKRKQGILLKEMATKQKEMKSLNQKVIQYKEYATKIKKERNDYKQAWDITEDKLRNCKKEWKNDQYDL